MPTFIRCALRAVVIPAAGNACKRVPVRHGLRQLLRAANADRVGKAADAPGVGKEDRKETVIAPSFAFADVTEGDAGHRELFHCPRKPGMALTIGFGLLFTVHVLNL